MNFFKKKLLLKIPTNLQSSNSSRDSAKGEQKVSEIKFRFPRASLRKKIDSVLVKVVVNSCEFNGVAIGPGTHYQLVSTNILTLGRGTHSQFAGDQRKITKTLA